MATNTMSLRPELNNIKFVEKKPKQMITRNSPINQAGNSLTIDNTSYQILEYALPSNRVQNLGSSDCFIPVKGTVTMTDNAKYATLFNDTCGLVYGVKLSYLNGASIIDQQYIPHFMRAMNPILYTKKQLIEQPQDSFFHACRVADTTGFNSNGFVLNPASLPSMLGENRKLDGALLTTSAANGTPATSLYEPQHMLDCNLYVAPPAAGATAVHFYKRIYLKHLTPAFIDAWLMFGAETRLEITFNKFSGFIYEKTGTLPVTATGHANVASVLLENMDLYVPICLEDSVVADITRKFVNNTLSYPMPYIYTQKQSTSGTGSKSLNTTINKSFGKKLRGIYTTCYPTSATFEETYNNSNFNAVKYNGVRVQINDEQLDSNWLYSDWVPANGQFDLYDHCVDTLEQSSNNTRLTHQFNCVIVNDFVGARAMDGTHSDRHITGGLDMEKYGASALVSLNINNQVEAGGLTWFTWFIFDRELKLGKDIGAVLE